MIKNFFNKSNTKKIFLTLIFFIFVSCSQSEIANKENSNTKVTIKVFSSLTCPHCANFHEKVIIKLKEDYIDTNRVKFEHHGFLLIWQL